MSAPAVSTLAALLRTASEILGRAGIADPVGDARHLAAHGLDVPRDRLTLMLNDTLSGAQVRRVQALIQARATRVPVSHLTGRRLFWGREFIVTADTLDPRPETETLIAAALELRFASVLDLGTGTGAILLTLLAERPETRGLGTDVSPAALAVASRNAAALDLAGRATFARSDWCAKVTGRFDLIVSNPPYIAAADMAGLAAEVRDHEPRLALTDGADGLSAYRAILAQAPAHLADGGALLFEIGASQGAAVCDLAAAAGGFGARLHSDLDGRDRVVEIRQNRHAGGSDDRQDTR